ncbi:dienelactone hydrolase family protein [Vibrio ziniensis]|uniref:Hydrolase n=1 Tax=Vibrio ziniensis TaxID=2711221 RepID=A0A6G7CQA1_9VIBR|nr:alpha/beta hydrolase family protein [Vibrio ziniensis]QIH44259.1 hydrolase [Vibrio ziniensis]
MKPAIFATLLTSVLALSPQLSYADAANGPDYQTQAFDSAERTFPLFYEKLKERMPFSMGWEKNQLTPEQWRTQGLEKARELLLPYQDNTPFNPLVIDEVDRGSYVAQKVVFNISDESRVLALMLVPKGDGPFPAALFLHDHGSKFDIGKEKFVKTWNDEARLASSQAWADKFFSGKYPGDELAKRGYVVLSIDALGWGDRSVPEFATNSQQALASNLFNLGTSFAGIIALEDVRASEFLASQPKVDKTRVASIGFSMGAFRSWQLAALSDSITASIVDCWMGTMKGLMVPGNNQLKGQSAFSMLHPYIARYLDYPDIASLAAPKPMLVYAGGQDKLFPVDAVKSAFSTMHAVWKANNVEDKLQTKIWEDKGHTFTEDMQKESFDWLDKQFGL